MLSNCCEAASPASATGAALQALLEPGVLRVTPSNSQPQTVSVTLTRRPKSEVHVSISVPNAWDGVPIADVFSNKLVIQPDAWNVAQTFELRPKLVCEGDYFVTLNFM
jgi:hypothetical protein